VRAAGLYLRRHFSSAVAPMSRLQTRYVWELGLFVLNAAIFLVLGAQFRSLLADGAARLRGRARPRGRRDRRGRDRRAARVVPIVTALPRLVSRRTRRGRPDAAVEAGVPRGVDEHARHRLARHRARAAAAARERRAVPVPERDRW
jgi:CPA1 family monovalent cation:H+ antiporter